LIPHARDRLKRRHVLPCATAAQTAANWVLRESKAVYRAASEGVINLADKFFEMERSDALRCGGGGGVAAGAAPAAKAYA
jgi:hypothetical protein